VTSDKNDRVVRRGPSWAPPVSAETHPPGPPAAPPPPVSPKQGAADRPPLRVAETGGRSQPPSAAARLDGEQAAGARIGASAPRVPLVAEQAAREVQPDYSTAPPRAETPAPPPGPRHHGEIGREVLRRPAKQPPRSGWRWLVWIVTFGLWNLGESPADARRAELVARVNQTIRGDYKIAMLSMKGGVGKTTTTVGLGSTFASLRGDHVVAADANPDRGTLGARIPTQTAATVRDLLNDVPNIHRYSDVRAFTSQAPSRLEVLASERDPHKSEAFSEADYRAPCRCWKGFTT